MQLKSAFSLLMILPFAQLVFAQEESHADIRPYVLNGKIYTRGYLDDTAEDLPETRVFGFDFGEDLDQPYFIGDPGFNSSAGAFLPGSVISFNVINAAQYGLNSNLTYWNGSGTVQFLTPNDETLNLSFGSFSTTVGADTGLQTGFNLQTVTAGGAIHRHVNSLLATGSVLPAEGIYLIGLELLSSDSSIMKSDPLFIVYNNGLTEAAHDQAIDWVQANLVTAAVPEPDIWIPAAIIAGCMCFALRRRRSLPTIRN